MIFRCNLFFLLSVFGGRCSQLGKLLILVGLMLAPVAWADNQGDKVNKVKAAFIYNIAKFVRWPDAHKDLSHLKICFYRTDFLGKSFDSIAGRDVHGKSVVKTIVEDLTQVDACSVLLISHFELPHYLHAYASSSPSIGVLTVADLTASTDHGKNRSGVLLSLIRRGSSIGFEVSLQQVRERQLQMSSQLLKLAHILDKGVR